MIRFKSHVMMIIFSGYVRIRNVWCSALSNWKYPMMDFRSGGHLESQKLPSLQISSSQCWNLSPEAPDQ